MKTSWFFLNKSYSFFQCESDPKDFKKLSLGLEQIYQWFVIQFLDTKLGKKSFSVYA